jgi:lipopolysaccharide transport system ATP-binding protein
LKTVIKVENLGKQYRLGEVGTGTLSHDLTRWWYRMRGKEDPFLKIGEVNDRTQKSETPYVWALKNVNFEIGKGEVLGVIGKNGAGKSTLLKLLSRVTGPSEGSIKVRGRIASLLEVGTGFHPELTGRDNIFLNGAVLGMTRKEIESKLDEIISFSGIERYVDTPVKRYSSGMLVRLGFAVAAHLEPEILIVDEVLAVGDVEFQNKCLGKMNEVSQSGRTIIFVSHNMQAVSQLCTRAILIENGTVTLNGSVQEVIKNYLADAVAVGEPSINYSGYPNRKGNGKIQISKIEVYNGGVLNNRFVIGDDIVIRLHLRSQEMTKNCKLAFHLYKYDKSVIANIENTDSDFVIEPFTGERCFEIVFSKINFYPDRYTVGISIGTFDWSEYFDQIIPCFEFAIIEGSALVKRKLSSSGGLVYIVPAWKLIGGHQN